MTLNFVKKSLNGFFWYTYIGATAALARFDGGPILVGTRPVDLLDLEGAGVAHSLDLGHLDQLGRALHASHVHNGGVGGALADTLIERVPAEKILFFLIHNHFHLAQLVIILSFE